MHKFITIKNRCQVLTSRGMCMGPTYVPFKEDLHHIFQMVCDSKAEICEVNPDTDDELLLDVFNYDKVNFTPPVVLPIDTTPKNPAVFIDKPAEDKVEEVVIEEVIQESEEVAEEIIPETEDVDTIIETEPRERAQQVHSGKKNKNKNKHKQNYVNTEVEEA